MRYKFPKKERLRYRKDFIKLFKKSQKKTFPYFIIYFVENGLPYCRIGIIISKKIGKAVYRNKIRRWIKESYRVLKTQITNKGYDIVVIGRERLREKKIDFKMIYQEFNKIVNILNNLKEV